MEQTAQVLTYATAGTIAAAATLTKYVGLILLPVLLLAILWQRAWRQLFVLIVPIGLIAVWGVWSYFETGRVHLLQPAIATIGAQFSTHVIDWLICLGTITPFSLLFVPTLLRHRITRIALGAIVVAASFYAPARIETPIDDATLSFFARLLWANGLLVTLGTVSSLLLGISRTRSSQTDNPTIKNRETVLACLVLGLAWFLFSAVFILLFAQFIAVRHVMLVLPIVVLATSLLETSPRIRHLRDLALGITVTLGLALTWSDWQWSAVYRTEAKRFAEERLPSQNIWAVGNWGWQWYAKQVGLSTYHWGQALADGDLLVIPRSIDKQPLKPEHLERLHFSDSLVRFAPWSTWLRTMRTSIWGGYYASRGNVLPIHFSSEPLEYFSVYTVSNSTQRKLPLPYSIDFDTPLPNSVLATGMYPPEYWGRWSKGKAVHLAFPGLLPHRARITIYFRPLAGAPAKILTVRHGEASETVTLDRPLALIAVLQNDRQTHTISLETSETHNASQITSGNDRREIGFGIESLLIESAD